MAERTMTRIHRKLDEYPPEAREMVDKLLADPQMTYTDIAERLTLAGYEISKSAIHRYAAQSGADQQRLREIGEQTRRLVNRMQEAFLIKLRELVQGDEELTQRLAEMVEQAGQEVLAGES